MTDTATQEGAAEVTNEPASYDAGSDDLTSRLSSLLDPQPETEEVPHTSEADPAEPPDTSNTETEEEQPELYTVKIDGEERQVTRDDLINHYQKGIAASKRFEEAAQLRKSVEAEHHAIRTEREQLQGALNQYTQQLQAIMEQNQPNWAELLKNDPQKYLEERHAWEQRAVQLQQAQTAQTYLSQQQKAEQQQQLITFLKEQQGKLYEALPAWKDEKIATQERNAIKGYLQNMGFPEERISQIYDHREVLLVDKARKYDELMAKQQTANKRVAALPPRVEKPGVTDSGSHDLRARIAKLPKSISQDDAAGLFAQILDTSRDA